MQEPATVLQRLRDVFSPAPVPETTGPRRLRRPSVEPVNRSVRRFESTDRSFTHESLTDRGPILKAKTWACQLQGHGDREIDLDDVKTCQADAVIIDYSRDGSEATSRP
jgi:hypothetical protein